TTRTAGGVSGAHLSAASRGESQPMKLVAAMASGATGGGAEHLLGLLPALAERGVDVTAWVGEDGPLRVELEHAGISSAPLRLMHSRTDPMALFALRSRLNGERPDVVHWHGTRAAFYGTLTLSGVPSVYTAHGLAYRKETSAARRSLFLGAEAVACRADQVVSVSRTDRDDLIRHGLVRARRAHYVPNAIRFDRFRDRPARGAARKQLGLPQDAYLVGTTSRLVRQKAVHLTLKALEGVSGVEFVVAGDGPLRSALEADAKHRGVDVHWLGRRDDVPLVLSALDSFVLSSSWEGEPIALLEAMYCGLPCVATATEGAVELLADGAGYLSAVGDALALRAKLESVRTVPPDVALARRRAESRSFEAMAETVLGILEAACGRRPVER
ncbi:MAG: glycosyltransferase, partial [Myxococcota bacterium]